MRKIERMVITFLILLLGTYSEGFVISEAKFEELSSMVSDMSTGDRIAFWAESFVGTPYDPDPVGEYVRKGVIVADERVDCMYTTFRSVELAFSNNYSDAVANALNTRFLTHGRLDADGNVLNYEERYQYGIDMILSGKFGRNVTREIASPVSVKGERGIERVDIIAKKSALTNADKLRSGDIIFFVKDPSKRKVGEIIGHIGIVSVHEGGIFLIHASGNKNGNGEVKRVALGNYIDSMPFTGIMVTRFDTK
ncbi:MAG: hypothetical protein JSV21_00605 [Nitrospirota bacterium]|nr:MAG: hypothetical protein JSV21_00605 [Nitrospirota bacterium]